LGALTAIVRPLLAPYEVPSEFRRAPRGQRRAVLLNFDVTKPPTESTTLDRAVRRPDPPDTARLLCECAGRRCTAREPELTVGGAVVACLCDA
jgi:hypothetical protein